MANLHVADVNDLKQKHEEYEMSIFLSAVEFIQKLTN